MRLQTNEKVVPQTPLIDDKELKFPVLRSISTALVLLLVLIVVTMLLIIVAWIVIFFTGVNEISDSLQEAVLKGMVTHAKSLLEKTRILGETIFLVAKHKFVDIYNISEIQNIVYEFSVLSEHDLDVTHHQILIARFYKDERIPSGGPLLVYYDCHFVKDENNRLIERFDEVVYDKTDIGTKEANFTTDTQYGYYIPRSLTGEINYTNIGPPSFEIQISTSFEDFFQVDKAPSWKPAFIDVDGKNPIISYECQEPLSLLETKGEVQASSSCIALGSLSTFLAANTRFDGISVIIELPTQVLLATSDPEIKLTKEQDGEIVLREVKDVENDIVRETVATLKRKYGDDFANMTEGNIELMSFQHSSKGVVKVAAAYISDGEGQHWLITFSVPFTQLASKFLLIGLITSVIGGLLSLTCLSAGCFSIYAIIKPLKTLVQGIERVKDLDLNEQFTKFSFFLEVYKIQLAFNRMIQVLKEYKAFLPSVMIDKIEKEPKRYKSRKSISSISTSSRLSLSISMQDTRQIFQTGLNEVYLTVMKVHIVNCDSLMNYITLNDYVQMHGALLKEMSPVIARCRGIITETTHDSFVVTWSNTSQHQSSLAAGSGLEIMDKKISHLNSVWKNKDLPEMKIIISIAAGEGYDGNMGYNEKRVHTIIGKPRIHVDILLEYCMKLGTKILVNDTAKKFFSSKYITRSVPPLYIENKMVEICELCTEEVSVADEWMYELEEQEKYQVYTDCEKAYQFVQQKSYKHAASEYLKIFEKNPEDQFCKTMADLCNKMDGTKPLQFVYSKSCIVEQK